MNFKKNNTIIQSWNAVKYVMLRDKNGKKYIIFKFLVSVFGALLPLAVVILPGKIINSINSDAINYFELGLYVSILSIYPLVWYLLKYILNKQIIKSASEFNIHSNELVYNQLAKIDFEDLETSEVQQLKDRATSAMEKLLSIVDIFCGFFSNIIGLISMCVLISSLNPLIIVLLIVLVVLNTLSSKWLQKKSRESRLKADILNRRRMTYSYAFDDLWFAKEMRLFQSHHFLIRQMAQNERKTNENHIEYIRNEGLANLVPILTSMIQQIIIYVYLIFLVIQKNLLIGTMTMYLSAVASLFTAINSLFSSYLSLANKRYDLDDIFEYFSMDLRQATMGHQKTDDRIESIEFLDVSFKYPGSERFALENINIKIKGGERLCIVGENGAGKSTFINLLTRMYFPTSGKIFLNGKDIYEYDYLEYIKLFAPVFQDFCKYEFELKNNICLSNEIDEQKLNEALCSSSLVSLVEKLPKKENTFIGKYVDSEGFEPSGGEAQRIAIARALYHGGEIYVLDEPTAALDPNAEYEIYTQFHNMIKNKTAIMITHRLSAVQLADKVAVFDNGHIAEYGTHGELYAKDGIYTEMFDKQAHFYKIENDIQQIK